MSWYARLMLVLLGLFLAAYGKVELARGHLAYLNSTYRQPVFAPAVIALGCLFILLAALPSGDWVYRRISARKTRKPFEAGSSRKTRKLLGRR